MKRVFHAMTACTALCFLAWAVGTHDVRVISAVGVLCAFAACLAYLWRDGLRTILSRAACGAPPSISSPLRFVIAAVFLLLVLVGSGRRRMIPVPDLLLWGLVAGVVAVLVSRISRCLGARRTRCHRPVPRHAHMPTPTPGVVPSATPPPGKDGDMDKTRPMPSP